MERNQDGIPNRHDRCPAVDEAPDGFEDEDGCPDEFEEEAPVIVHAIRFETDSATLLDTSKSVLDEIASVMKRHPEMRVRVEGHADDRGTEADNLVLSQKRARSVVEYLVEDAGIERDRLESAGFGESEPLVDGATESARAKNRRVEFKVLGAEE